MTDAVLDLLPLRSRVNRAVLAALVGLAVAAVVGTWLAIHYVESEKQRDLQAWQRQLGIVADSRTTAVNEWLASQFATLQDLAENGSLQLYLTELTLGGSAPSDQDPAEFSYLRNYLTATAEREGFAERESASTIDANLERVGAAGIALTDANGKVLVWTDNMPPLIAPITQAIDHARASGPSLIDVYLGSRQQPSIGFVVPVYAIQEDEGNAAPIGFVVGIKLLGKELFDRLIQPGETAATAESYLVRHIAPRLDYLTPLADGTQPLQRSLADDTPDLADWFVIQRPGGFAQKRDYRGRDVLVTGRAVVGAPWYLVRTVGAEEALTEIVSRGRTRLAVFLLIITGMSLTLIAVWRHSTSMRAAEAAEHFRVTAEKFQTVTAFLRAVTDGLPNPILAVDADDRLTFVNMVGALASGFHPRELIGKPAAAALGPAVAGLFQGLNRRAIADQALVSEIHEIYQQGQSQVLKSDHLPLAATRARPAGALVLVSDLTELTNHRRRAERILRHLVGTLVTLVDRRDPYAAHHSSRVAEVARAIAEEMATDARSRDTIEFAAKLINIGKILVPRALLVKLGELTDDERAALRNALHAGADLLKEVEFDGPVVETIRQVQERWDGSGPLGLAGEAILVEARIVAVANAFVGMVSSRAYRQPIGSNRSARILSEQSGTVFDRRPVSALINIIDNRGGAERWSSFGQPPDASQTGSHSGG